MGKTLAKKKEIVADLKETLSEAQLAFVINYEGLSVAEITDLRNRLRPTGASCKITKNTLMNIAVDGDENWQPMQEFLSDATAFLFTGEEIGAAVKAYKGFQEEFKKTELRGGVMEGKALSKVQVEALGDLPTKDQLYAQIAGCINASIARIGFAIKEVPTSLTRQLHTLVEEEKIPSEVSQNSKTTDSGGSDDPGSNDDNESKFDIVLPPECFIQREVNLVLKLPCLKYPQLEESKLHIAVTADGFNNPFCDETLEMRELSISKDIKFTLIPVKPEKRTIQVEFFLDSVRVGYYIVNTTVIENK